ncbi:OmpA family protein [Neisseria sp. Ec49-e6-T10]|uniref:OmpA family protein n=1 Tax=Neisseria sp. Ec49-e6-T10 TaxID=3140744 RepID=UPI003EC0D782
MGQLAKNIFTLISLITVLTGCAVYEPQSESKKRLWRIEQNGFGKFVYCQTDIDCPERTPKTLNAYNSKPQKTQTTQDFDASKVVAKVYFAFGKANLSQASIKTLKGIAPQLKGNQIIVLRGWTDPVSGKNSIVNQKLALQRATTVQKWLRQHGVRSEIQLKSQPPCCNDSTATARSPDSVRVKMRIVTIELLAQ